MSNLKTVEEMVKKITDYNENVGNICYPSDVEVQIAQDRQAACDELVRLLELQKEDFVAMMGEKERETVSRINRKIDQAITIVKEVYKVGETMTKEELEAEGDWEENPEQPFEIEMQ